MTAGVHKTTQNQLWSVQIVGKHCLSTQRVFPKFLGIYHKPWEGPRKCLGRHFQRYFLIIFLKPKIKFSKISERTLSRVHTERVFFKFLAFSKSHAQAPDNFGASFLEICSNLINLEPQITSQKCWKTLQIASRSFATLNGLLGPCIVKISSWAKLKDVLHTYTVSLQFLHKSINFNS